MIDIAGSDERFFNVSNYAALEKILSSLEKSIIGIEGKLFENKCKSLVLVNNWSINYASALLNFHIGQNTADFTDFYDCACSKML